MSVSLVHLPDGTDWLMKPVMRHLCKYESLVDGTVNLEDLGRMNDAIAVQDENEHRMNEARK